MSNDNTALRLAIIGGGLAGLAIAHSLLNHSHIDVQIYESAPEFRERGAAVGLSKNAQAAMKLIGPSLYGVLDAAGAVHNHSTRIMIGEGSNRGAFVVDEFSDSTLLVVHRAQLLQELLRPIPPEILHVNKKLLRIEEEHDDGSGAMVIHFRDGTLARANALIGADGIHGNVRSHILQNGPTSAPRFAGWWDCRALVPIDRALELLGREVINPEEPRQHRWIGDGKFLMHDVCDNGKTVQCLAAVLTDEQWNPHEWKRSLTKEELLDVYSNWGAFGKSMAELLASNPDLAAFSEWESAMAPTYSRGRSCVIGDAADTPTPWQGAGVGQAMEDVLILQRLLLQVTKVSEIAAAFQAYDKITI